MGEPIVAESRAQRARQYPQLDTTSGFFFDMIMQERCDMSASQEVVRLLRLHLTLSKQAWDGALKSQHVLGKETE
jgi:hypothetical protein